MANQLVPFGKYKGQPLEVLLADTQYMTWLSEQPWVKERYPVVQTLIINNFGEPDETPEHNKIQNNFFSSEYVFAFVLETLLYKNADKIVKSLDLHISRAKQIYEKQSEQIANLDSIVLPDGFQLFSPEEMSLFCEITGGRCCEAKRELSYGDRINANALRWSAERAEDFIEEFSKYRAMISDFSFFINESFSFQVESEVSGWDIELEVSAYKDAFRIWEIYSRVFSFPDRFLIEIKPEIGDDFPAILRQMKANAERIERKEGDIDNWYYLVYNTFRSSAATEESVKKQFLASGFVMVREDEYWPMSGKVLDCYLEGSNKKLIGGNDK